MTRSTFGSIRRLPSGRWQGCYFHEGQRFTAPATFSTKGDADAWLARQQTDIRGGAWVDPDAGRISFRQYAEQWRAAQVHHRPATAAQIETHLRRHVYPGLGDRPLASIRPSDVRGLIQALSTSDSDRRGLAPATVEVVYSWVASIFKAAVNDRVIATSPCRGISRPTVYKERVQPLRPETVEALTRAVPDRYRAIVLLGAGTGVRIAEALGLTNDRVDWMRRSVTIDRQLVGIGHGGLPQFGPVKDRRNRPRVIPLPQSVLDELAAHVARFGLGPEGLLFTGPRGGPIRRTTFSDMWQAAAGPLGIPTGDGYHQLRHFYASVLIRAGESVKVVQDRLGHASATMTLDTYAGLWPEDQERTRTALDDVLRPVIAHVARTKSGYPR